MVFPENRVTHMTGANMQKPGNWLKQRFEAVMGVIVAIPAIPGAIIDHYAISHRQARDPVRQRKRSSETAIIVICLFLTILVAIIDYRSTARVSFTLFYLLIAAYAAWSGSRRAGILIALASSLAAFVGEAGHDLPTGRSVLESRECRREFRCLSCCCCPRSAT